MLTRKGKLTRDRIVRTAAKLMLSRGVGGTTMDLVREEAGVSFSQLYHYFANKADLIQAVIEHQADAIVVNQPPPLDDLASLRAWRDSLLQIQRRAKCRGGCPLGTLSSELSEISEDARFQLMAGFARWEASLRRGITTMHERGELRDGIDPGKLALVMLAAVQGGLVLTQVRREIAPLEAALDGVLALVESSLSQAH